MTTMTLLAPVVNANRKASIEVEVEYRPDWQGDAYEPTPEEDARRLGFELGLADEPARPSRGMSIRVQDAWYNGWLAGNLARVEAERQELNDWYDSLEQPDWDSMYPDFDPLHPIERAEAGPVRQGTP